MVFEPVEVSHERCEFNCLGNHCNVFCKPRSLSGETMNLARLAHWARVACLCGEAFEMAKLVASLLEPVGLASPAG